MIENKLHTKDYKYKLKLADDIHDVRRVYGDTRRQTMEIVRKNRKGFFKPTLNVREKDLKVTRKTASEYGEFIASKIADITRIPVCDAEFVIKKVPYKYSKSGKSKEIPGCISYCELKTGETLLHAINIIDWYKNEHAEEYLRIANSSGNYQEKRSKVTSDNSTSNNNIEVVIPAFEAYIREKCGGTQEKSEEIKQNLIEMVVFDCCFANRDRNDENYGLAISEDGNVRFYPMYDNEYILGFSEVEDDIRKYDAASLQQHINKDLYSLMGISSQPTKISSAAMMTYLFTAYPEETKKAYDKVSEFKELNLVEIMDECEGLSELHKAYALRIFRLRQKEIESIKDEYFDEQGNLIPQGLLSINASKRQAPSLDD